MLSVISLIMYPEVKYICSCVNTFITWKSVLFNLPVPQEAEHGLHLDQFFHFGKTVKLTLHGDGFFFIMSYFEILDLPWNNAHS